MKWKREKNTNTHIQKAIQPIQVRAVYREWNRANEQIHLTSGMSGSCANATKTFRNEFTWIYVYMPIKQHNFYIHFSRIVVGSHFFPLFAPDLAPTNPRFSLVHCANSFCLNSFCVFIMQFFTTFSTSYFSGVFFFLRLLFMCLINGFKTYTYGNALKNNAKTKYDRYIWSRRRGGTHEKKIFITFIWEKE